MSSTIRRLSFLMPVLSLTVVAGPAAQESAALDQRAIVEYLADDELEGRLTGSPGIRMAADYIVEQLEAIGAEPLPGVGGFRQSFSYTAGVTDTGTTIELTGSDLTLRIQPEGDGPSVRALSFSDTGRAEGQLVFAGYGLSVPETDDFGYDSYATLDVSGKIVVVFRYFPEDTEGELRATLARYAGLRYKALAARERGAAGLIVVTGPRSPNAGALVPLTFDTAVSDSGIVAATVDGALGAAIIESAGESIEAVQASLDTANPHVTGFDLPLEGVIEARLERREATGHNVIGYLPPTTGAELPKPYVVLGAHYDHLGRGRGGDSLARGDEAGQIHNGADDNASGVTAVLAAGAGLAGAERGRGVVLALWSGEELGLLGSADFVEQAPVPMDRIAAYLNFDMVGRLRDNTLNLQAVGSSSIWTGLAKELNEPVGLDLTFVADPYLPTDVGSLNAAEVPSLNFFTGSHEDYHRPTDDAGTLDYEGSSASSTSRAANLVTRPDAPDFIRGARAQRGGGATMRIFTGTIPDYTQEVEGLSLSGVIGAARPRPPACRAATSSSGSPDRPSPTSTTTCTARPAEGERAEVVFMRDGADDHRADSAGAGLGTVSSCASAIHRVACDLDVGTSS